MNQTARIISIYAADTSGVCSALYEFGGMTVIHDASGCNSTYTTHDEPRWYDIDSMMYISGLTENDAVMGNDDKFITDLIRAAKELKPEFVAICASPMPAMIGIDMDAIAYEVESETGIPAFDVKTNGMQSYITGAGNAFLKLAERFADEMYESAQLADRSGEQSDKIKVNILGMTPLDFPLGTDMKIREWLESEGFEVNSCIGMGCSLEDVKRLGAGNVSLVVSSVGRPLAEWLRDRFGIPFTVGVPYGKKFSALLAKGLREKIETVTIDSRIHDSRIAVVGESILSTSLAAALSLEYGVGTRVLETVGEGDMSQLCPTDISCDDEDELERELSKSDIIIGDPLFEPICRGKQFIRLPHDAFSGRCFHKEAKDLIGDMNSSIGVIINDKDSSIR